ncbi:MULTISPECIES: RNA polymerase sigma factor [Thalassotalea]|uniref:RNA polymerase sigma factor n=1 Tax=Thalassotalea TaxID=1518149 RepID=UPI00158819D9|nr:MULTISPECIES: DUF6596 domain-containing protein [Thalassotalea]
MLKLGQLWLLNNLIIQECITTAYGTALAVLVRQLGDLDQAQDSLQHACEKALTHWKDSIPNNPKAWLISAAKNFAIDSWRKQNRFEPHRSSVTFTIEQAYNFEDATLSLIFTCCHPTIAIDNQVALTLKFVFGFDDKTIASALLIPHKTLEQRVTRSKRKIKNNNFDFSLPSAKHLEARISGVLKVIYLVFNEGYYSNSGSKSFVSLLCKQAIDLLSSLCRTFRGKPNALALLALMTFSYARIPARNEHHFISLEIQDRSLWNKKLINNADILLQKSLMFGTVSSYHIEAAISGLHCQSSNFQNTDWQQISLLYLKLREYNQSPAVVVNHAAALLMNKEVNKAKIQLASIEQLMKNYLPYYMVLGKSFELEHNATQAINAYHNALKLSKNRIERQLIIDKITRLNA